MINFGSIDRVVLIVIGMLAPSLVSVSRAQDSETQSNIVAYPASFFAVYGPITALDMVARVPGFTLNEGQEKRGFGSTAGNVLIGGERPSTKTDSLADVLERIPAQRVERIEVRRGAGGTLNAQQQSVVVNVVLKASQADGASVTWNATLERDGGRLAPRGEASISSSLGAVDFTIGLERSDFRWRETGTESFFSNFAPSEDRMEEENGAYKAWSGTIKTKTLFQNGSILNVNVQVTDDRFELLDQSFRSLALALEPDLFDQGFVQEAINLEVSGDYSFKINDQFAVKLIALSSLEDEDGVSRLTITRPDASSEDSLFGFRNKNGEVIARLELTSSHWRRHDLQVGIEGVYTFVDSSSEFSIDFGGGPVQIDIDGANTRVQEIRSEALFLDSWTVSDALNITAGFALEISTIKQSGDIINERTFLYPKPTLAITFDASAHTQLRARFEREVAQLDFSEFVSATNFGDNDIDFGNPELQPERTWGFEAEVERRFGEVGVITVTAFYDRINDVQDLLPLGASFEIPGNIGDGARWGGEIEATLPLDAFHLPDARLEISAYIQDSSVIDPVTGVGRTLSLERPWNYAVKFRKDFPAHNFTFGWELEDSARERFFGLDETVTVDEGIEAGVFVETTVLPFAKLRLSGGNLINKNETRRRTVFTGSRSVAPVNFVEDRLRHRGRNFSLTLSGSF